MQLYRFGRTTPGGAFEGSNPPPPFPPPTNNSALRELFLMGNPASSPPPTHPEQLGPARALPGGEPCDAPLGERVAGLRDRHPPPGIFSLSLFYSPPQPPFSHMSHTRFSHISRINPFLCPSWKNWTASRSRGQNVSKRSSGSRNLRWSLDPPPPILTPPYSSPLHSNAPAAPAA